MAAHRGVEIQNIFFFYFFNDKEPNEACRWEIFNIFMPSCVRFSGSPVKFRNFKPLHMFHLCSMMVHFILMQACTDFFMFTFCPLAFVCQWKHILLFITA